jgi:hypothetical protein
MASIGYAKDYFLQQEKIGVMCRFPDFAYTDALAEIGNDRGIEQGSSSYGGTPEAPTAYAADLKSAWSTWNWAGCWYGLLTQLARQGYDNVVALQQEQFAVTLDTETDALVYTQLPTYPGGLLAGQRVMFDLTQPTTVGGQAQPIKVMLNGAIGQVPYSPTVPEVVGAIPFRRWARFQLIFGPSNLPASWTDIATPLTSSTAPSLNEINLIRKLIQKWGPSSVCLGISAIVSGRMRAWPLRNFGDGANFQDSEVVTWSATIGSST